MSGAVLFFGSSVSLNAVSTPASASGNSFGSGSATTPPVTLSATNGTAPFSGSWSYVSGDITITADSPTSMTTTFTGDVPLGGSIYAVFRGTIIDSSGGTGSVDVGVLLIDASFNFGPIF